MKRGQKINRTHKMTNILSFVKRKEWSEVISRSKFASSDEILERDASSFNATALHVALSLDAPFEVVRCLLCHGHQAAQLKEDRNGYLPLHSAIRHRSSMEIITLLIATYKEGVSARDKNQNSSLHLACYFNSSSSLVDLLLRSDPSLAKMRTKQNSTALHIACCCKAKSSIVKYLLKLYPEAAREPIAGQWLPLHLAVWHEASEEVIINLISVNPEATEMVTSSSGQTPLSLYWSNSTLSKNIVLMLLDPTILKRNENEHGNDHGLVHKVLRFPQYIPNLLTYILNEFKDDVKCWDDEGRLPLHVAIELRNDVGKSAWKNIFRRYPNAILQCERKRFLYPFMMASVRSDLDLTFELIRLAPNVFEHLCST